ncbi:hypothetical protein ACVT8L_000511 [Campylobacter jejuni]|nr:hypothetical protein [Campylobacter jejuni]EIV7451386.1 hypothetical protein [Campylobacter jejuni]EJP0847306.1 hypothetical protein [Campylobacter jejuni]EJP8735901.1 hypothetical protein [Campylobacter jejuni]EJU5759004.1 hypothetical protein [Campylobacter jejuni]
MSSGIFLSFTDSYGDILIIRFLTGLVLAESISNYFGNWRDSLSFYAWINLILLIL